MTMAEMEMLVKQGQLQVDGKIVVNDRGDLAVNKAAVEPVWYLPGVAERFGIDEGLLRRALFEDTGGMYPELITRPDLKVYLPPIGGISVYVFGNPAYISGKETRWMRKKMIHVLTRSHCAADPEKKLTLRVHDECNGSDVFGKKGKGLLGGVFVQNNQHKRGCFPH